MLSIQNSKSIILHQQRTPQLFKQKKLMQTQEDHSNLIIALNVDSLKVDLVIIQNTCSKKEDSNFETASSKSVKESSLDSAIKDAFMSLFDQDVDTFISKMLLNVDQLQKQLDKDEFQDDGSMAAFWVYDRRVNKRQIQTQESKIDTGKAVDANLVVTESSGTELEVQDDNSRSGNDTDVDDPNIRPIYDEEPMAEIQEKVFAIAALKNELRKLKGNSLDTTFAKTSVLGKPVLQSLRNNSVVRQPNAFKSERPPIVEIKMYGEGSGPYIGALNLFLLITYSSSSSLSLSAVLRTSDLAAWKV
ncbi:hypothetical protein Tco_0222448 [Tanacetum coccineum]